MALPGLSAPSLENGWAREPVRPTTSITGFWIDDLEVEYDRSVDEDEVVRRSTRTRGLDCAASDGARPDAVLWRFRAGIAPPLDLLAAAYDSLAAEDSPAVSAHPPLSLERLPAEGVEHARYEIRRAGQALRFVATDGRPVAVIHAAIQATLDLAPDAGEEEKRLLRLLAAALLQRPGI